MVKVDLHVHTHWSDDSLTTCAEVLCWAGRRDIDLVAITDHNRLGGALALKEMAPERVIVGEEIRTTQGEIIGLFLHEEILGGLATRETTRCIHQQGGLVYVPHPVDRVRRSTLMPPALLEIIDEIDLIEVFNARVPLALCNRQAEELARFYGLPQGAGSDAHQGHEIGRAYVEMPAFDDAQSFLANLIHGQIHGRLSSPLVHVGSTYAKFAKGLMTFTSSAR
ncbi:MAG: hypothetical protein A2Y73_08025 [Chloroflexi bacterium RBG_13_56_8]|nr:MAG: hypothetical protein A2Y73_08025 [Chloroflexi bacterium RBG_13_56_8]